MRILAYITVLVLSTPIVYDRYTDGDVSGARHPYCWQIRSGTGKIYTDSETPSVGDFTYTTAQATQEDLSINSIVLPSPETETIAGTTISYYEAADGHKLVLPDQESNVTAIYNATGVAWYYIIDTTNQRFKLPRTKFGVTGIRSGVGKFVEAGLPNLTGNAYSNGNDFVGTTTTGVFSGTTHRNGYGIGTTNVPYGNFANPLNFNASLSNSIYGNSDTVQPKATEMYLYFYVGQFTQTALENTAGLNAELFNGKVDTGHQVIAFQAPTANNNYTWYRKYADGWVEQGGIADYGSYNYNTRSVQVSLPVVMSNAQYQVLAGYKDADSPNDYALYCGYNPNQLTTTGFRMTTWTPDSGCQYRYVWWQVSGMAA